MQHQFQDAGISMYSKVYEYHDDFVGMPLIGEAIISDLLTYIDKGNDQLTTYLMEEEKSIERRSEEFKKLEKYSPVRKFFASIRNFFLPAKRPNIDITQEEKEALCSCLSGYQDINEQLSDYNLKDNLVSSVVRLIQERKYDSLMLPALLEEEIAPDLQKLGLSDLIPQLQQALVEEYKKDLPNPEIYQIKPEDMHLYVPDFTRTVQNSKELEQERFQKQSDNLIMKEDSKKSLAQGVAKEDLASIDETVNATDRQTTMDTIKGELHPDVENNQDKTQETDDISLE